MEVDEVRLGDGYRDSITGFEGTATGRYEYLNGCVRVGLEAKGKEGEPVEYTFDVERLVPTETASHPMGQPSGGPRTTPPRRSTR